jgi:hypothetical protein
MLRYLIGGAAVGILLPVLVLIDHEFQIGIFNGSYWILVLWPSSFMLMALNSALSSTAIFYVLLSILINAVFYGIFGGIAGLLHSFWRLSSAKEGTERDMLQ